MGHADIRTTRRYIYLEKSQIKKHTNRLLRNNINRKTMLKENAIENEQETD